MDDDVGDDWTWDPTLYAGSAAYYPRGREPYPSALVDALVAELGLDGGGALLDVGCGPGSLTLLLAPHVGHATGLDADAAMLAEATRQAAAAGVTNADWLHARAEDLPPGLGPFRLVTLAQSFHWMDRERVARLLRTVLEPAGALVHVHATTHRGVHPDDGGGRHGDAGVGLAHPRPPWPDVDRLVRDTLGPRRRAGQSTRPPAAPEAERGAVEAAAYRAAGFGGPTRLAVPGRVVVRSTDDLVASVFSLSSAAPHLFGAGVTAFERRLRALLAAASPDGVFAEHLREVAADVWRPAPAA